MGNELGVLMMLAAIALLVIAVLWVLVPFILMRGNEVRREMRAAQRETNRLLAEIQTELRAARSAQRDVKG
jgi:predicted PurR-regulated permease PerM